MLPISLRLSLVIALVLLLAVVVTAMLNVLKFQQVMEGFEETRYSFVARDIAGVLEQSMNLGLPLEQIDSAQQLIETQLELDPSISSIALFDIEGEVLFQTSRMPPGRAASVLFGSEDDGVLVGESFSSTQIENSFGQVVGGVFVRHSAVVRAQRNETILQVMSVAALGAAIVGIIVLWLGSSQLLRPLRRRLADATAMLQKAADGDPVPSADRSGFETLASTVLHDLRLAEREVDDIVSPTETDTKNAP